MPYPNQPVYPAYYGAQPNAYTYSSHYAQAYMQTNNTVPGSSQMAYHQPIGLPLNPHLRQAALTSMPVRNLPMRANPGDQRCTYKDCKFVGPRKALEIHRMDRHLIYPPGWQKKPKADCWDADPSLKGKKIPIQGTNICLDTPEAIELWIAERKKRFPTQANIEEKKRKREEALARGQISVDDPGLLGLNKRRRIETQNRGMSDRGRGRGRGRGRARGNAAFRSNNIGVPQDNLEKPVTTNDNDEQENNTTASKTTGTLPLASYSSSDSSDSNSDSDDEPPEAVSSRLAVTTEVQDKHEDPLNSVGPEQSGNTLGTIGTAAEVSIEDKKDSTRPLQKPPPRRPKGPLNNPFAARPYLLRNLLLPEIRNTVSNLSQAIRFLVDNNFLRDVEMKPGEADERPIEIIGES